MKVRTSDQIESLRSHRLMGELAMVPYRILLLLSLVNGWLPEMQFYKFYSAATYGIDSDAKVLSIDALNRRTLYGDADEGDAQSDSYSEYGFHSRRRKRRNDRISDSPSSSASTGSFLGVVDYYFPMHYSDISSSDHFIPSLKYVVDFVSEKESGTRPSVLNDCINEKDIFQYHLECESAKVII
jgi:hypothetical protein